MFRVPKIISEPGQIKKKKKDPLTKTSLVYSSIPLKSLHLKAEDSTQSPKLAGIGTPYSKCLKKLG